MTETPSQAASAPFSPELARRIQEEIGQNVYLCYQCVKCTSGCPVAEFFDWQPNQIMRALQLGQEDIALGAQTPWLCAACQTCTTRCPQGLDIAAIMEFLTREARARGMAPPVPQVTIFNEAFLREVRLWGRAYELGLMAEMKLRTRQFTDDMDLGMKMLRKRKLAFVPRRVRPPRKVRPAVGAAQAVQPRVLALGADVALHQVDLLHGHVEPVALRVLQQQVLACRAVGGHLDQAAVAPDPVVDVDHVVAGHQVGPRGQPLAVLEEAHPRAAAAPAEHFRVGDDGEPGRIEAEAAREPPRHDDDAARRRGRRHPR